MLNKKKKFDNGIFVSDGQSMRYPSSYFQLDIKFVIYPHPSFTGIEQWPNKNLPCQVVHWIRRVYLSMREQIPKRHCLLHQRSKLKVSLLSPIPTRKLFILLPTSKVSFEWDIELPVYEHSLMYINNLEGKHPEESPYGNFFYSNVSKLKALAHTW